MISSFRLTVGKAPGIPPESIACTPVTVFVGPNNSGKSKVLRELHHLFQHGSNQPGSVLLDAVEFQGTTPDVANRRIQEVESPPRLREAIQAGHIFIGSHSQRHQVPQEQLRAVLQDPSQSLSHYCNWYLSLRTLMLDGYSRIQLVNEQEGGDLQEPPRSTFQALFKNDARREQLRRIIHEAFGRYLVVDPTKLGRLRLRLSVVAPPSSTVERGLDDESRRFHAEAEQIEEGSDGVKAFTGMMSAIVAGDPELILIDEPEAFLHPALAFLLGKEISEAVRSSNKRIFASTHSPQFVMGCVQSGAPVNIVRLTYRDGVATARTLASADILRLMRNPLLRSTNVLTGLFFESVVVTEADTDRAFYQEINERLLRAKSGGISNCLFLNAQNKQTVPTILAPLRDLGIAAAGIVDIDALKEGGTVWTSLLNGAGIPELEHRSLADLRAAVCKAFAATGRDMKREGGVELLKDGDKEAVLNLFERFAQYGIFIIPAGELESWLRHLGVTGEGPKWLVKVFEKMGEDPDAAAYVLPTSDDVWQFVNQVRQWVQNPARKGLPS